MAELEVIEDKIVRLDGESFIRKAFRNCLLVYAGGTPPLLRHATFDGCDFRFEGPALNTLEFVNQISVGSGQGLELALSFIGVDPRRAAALVEKRGSENK